MSSAVISRMLSHRICYKYWMSLLAHPMMLRGTRLVMPFSMLEWGKKRQFTDHVMYMIEMIQHLSKLNFLLHQQLEKDAILNTLPKSYLPFLTHFWVTKSTVNYHSVLGLLQNFEKDHQLHKESVNVVRRSSFGRRPFKKGKKNKKNKKRVQSAGAPKPN